MTATYLLWALLADGFDRMFESGTVVPDGEYVEVLCWLGVLCPCSNQSLCDAVDALNIVFPGTYGQLVVKGGRLCGRGGAVCLSLLAFRRPVNVRGGFWCF